MFGSTFKGGKIDFRGIKFFWHVWMFSSKIDSNLKLVFGVFAATIEF